MKTIKENLDFKQNDIRFIYAGGKVAVYPHWHDVIEILYVCKGNFRQQIDDNVFFISQGDIVIIWSNQIHSTFSESDENGKLFCFQFKLTHLDFSLIDIAFNNKFRDNFIDDCICSIKDEYEVRHWKSGYRYMLESYIYRMLAYIAENKGKLPIVKSTAGMNHELVGKVVSYIEENYMNKITLQDIADYTHLSVPHFCRVFKKSTGYTFLKYLNMYRVEKSLIFLNDSQSVMNTAESCGFENQNTYIRLFKQFKGITPLQYKIMHY